MAAPRRRTEVILSILSGKPSQSIADLGCGSGELLREVKQKFPKTKLFGVDFSSAQIDENRRRDPCADWLVMDLDSAATFPAHMSGIFDAVIASELVEHLEHPEKLLSHAFSLARPGGLLIMTTQSGTMMETEKRVGHVRHFDRDDMMMLLKNSAWLPIEFWNEGWPFHDWSKKIANLDPDATMQKFGTIAYGPAKRAFCCMLRIAFRLNSRKKGAQLFAVAKKPS